jgi:aspartate/tyrosine/aromatic aminotransferase
MSSLLSALDPLEPDKIIRLMGMFAGDPRSDKIDLGVGVYKTADGQTPVMQAVTTAEARILAEQTTKSYVALSGDRAFREALGALVLGDVVAADRVASLATTGGTGAVRQGFELIRRANPDATVWLSEPTWPNHPAILDAMGMPYKTYRYFDAEAGTLDRAGMMADLARVSGGDVVLLHGCCHNPTGVDLAFEDWQAIAALFAHTGAVPMIDLAYQGFGAGVEEDVAGLRALVRLLPETLIAISGSKTFGLYRERVGLLLAVCATADQCRVTDGTLAWLNRLSYAFPPDHGARVVTTILRDRVLRTVWHAELDGMRTRINANRAAFVTALHHETGSNRFAALGQQHGMFSLLGASPEQVRRLREDHGLYMIGDSRINLAGITPDNVVRAARAIAGVVTAS